MTGKLYIKTHGCQMNEYDSAKMADVLGAAHGLELTENEAEADVILINTCSIREKAQEKVFSQLGRWKALKQANEAVVIGVGGCVASQEGDAIVKRAPYVDLVFGPQTLHRLPEMIEARRATGKPQVDISFPEIEKFDRLPEPRAEGPTAFVSIMEGCSKYCTFCVVPYTRGEEISPAVRRCRRRDRDARRAGRARGHAARPERQRVPRADARRLRNLRRLIDGKYADLGLLIHAIAEIDGIGRIRFMTSHPLEFSDSLIDAYANVPKLANFLHLPVQSGSDRILAAMKRGYTALEFKQKIRKLRAVRPGHLDLVGFHRRLPRRDRCRFREDDEADRRRRLRPELFVHLFQAPGHAGGESRRRHAGRGQARAPRASAGDDQRERARASARRWSAACSACWSKARAASARAS